jgi:PAS domain S-box-containing protein
VLALPRDAVFSAASVGAEGDMTAGQGETIDPALFGGNWRAAFMRLPIPVFIHDSAGKCLAVNARFTELTGFTADDIPDLRAWAARVRRIPENEIPALLQVARERYAAPSAPQREITVYHRDGARMIWLVNETGQVETAPGEKVIVSFAVDITEQRRAEEEAARRQREVDALYAASPLGLALIDRDLKVVRINAALADINGAPAANHVGRCIFDIAPDLRGQAEPLLRRVFETGETVNGVAFSGETAGTPGKQRDWVEHFHPVRDASGDIVGVGVVCEEVTETRAAERHLSAVMAELSRTLHLFRVALRAADVTAFAMDRERRFTWVSEGSWGRPASEMVGLRDEDAFPESRWAIAVPIKTRVLSEGGQQTFDAPTEIDGRRRVLQVRIEEMRDNEGEIVGLVGASIDITERKDHETHVESLLRELSHRSKNLLAVIQGLARHSAQRSASLPRFLEGFIRRLDSLARAQDLLTNANWRNVQLSDLIESQLGHHGGAERAGLRVEGPPIALSPRAVQNLGMALHELSTNAVKYGALSRPGGHVDLQWRIGGEGGGEPEFRMSWIESGGPPVATPDHKGFGHVVTQDLVARALLGKVTLEFAPEGLRWTLIAPKSSVVDDEALAEPPHAT